MNDLIVYAKVGENFQQIGGECPEGFIVMIGSRPEDERAADYNAMADGTWAIDPMIDYRKKVEAEVYWRDSELVFIADQLLRIEDVDPSALPGTDRQWRNYRIAVRAWVEGAVGFPDSLNRPVRPT